MRVMTLAEYRDAIRRDMGLPVASDKGGKVGDPASTHPRPTNALINQKLNDAVEKFNLEGGFAVANNVAVPVTAQTVNGPYSFSLWTLGASAGMKQGATYEVRRVRWDDGSGNRTRVDPASWEAIDRARREVDNMPPALPTCFWIEGNLLYISPAPASAGTLYLKVGTGVLDFDSDGDILESFPASVQPGIEFLAVALVALSQPSDPEMQVIAASYMPQADYYIEKAQALRQEQNVMLPARAAVASYRRGGRW
jgi:hypothetical protein